MSEILDVDLEEKHRRDQEMGYSYAFLEKSTLRKARCGPEKHREGTKVAYFYAFRMV